MAKPSLATPAAVRTLTARVLAQPPLDAVPRLTPPVLAQIEALFAGRYPGYLGCDMLFHDLTHTCDATLAVLDILAGHLQRSGLPALTARDVELAVTAALLHDTGYFKETTDTTGTGAKYTLVHVARSAEFAAKFLPPLGVSADEIRVIQLAIRCTGLNVDTTGLPFRDSREEFLGCVVGTGDMLGQLAAPQYPDRLPGLYREFLEGGVTGYESARDLMRQTRQFWNTRVQTLLEIQWRGVYRALTTDAYLRAIHENLDRIDQLLAPNP